MRETAGCRAAGAGHVDVILGQKLRSGAGIRQLNLDWGSPGMNKYLLMSAAAVLTTTAGAASASTESPAASGSQSIYATASGTTYCDAVTVNWTKKDYYAMSDSEEGCGTGYTGVIGYGQGIAGKTKKIGNQVDMSDGIEGVDGSNIGFNLTASTPIKNGGKFGVWFSYSGVTTFEAISGKYYFGTPPKAKAGHHPSFHSVFAAMHKTKS